MKTVGKRIDDATRDEIVKRVFAFHEDIKTVSAELGVSADAIVGTCSVLEIVKEQDWPRLIDTYEKHIYGSNLLKWAESRARVPIPKDVAESCSRATSIRNRNYREKDNPTPKPKPPHDETNVLTLVANLTAAVKEMDRQINSVFGGLMDAIMVLQQDVVPAIQAQTIDVKDNINANADVLGQRLDAMAATLERISKNTRRSGA